MINPHNQNHFTRTHLARDMLGGVANQFIGDRYGKGDVVLMNILVPNNPLESVVFAQGDKVSISIRAGQTASLR